MKVKTPSESQQKSIHAKVNETSAFMRGAHKRNLSPRLIIIAVESKKAEKQYFEEVIDIPSTVKIEVLETIDGCSSPDHVFYRLKTYKEKYETDGFGKIDEYWLMVDVDRWPQLEDAEIAAEKLGYQVAISKPCFEIWLLCHLPDVVIPEKLGSCSRTVKPLLHNHEALGSYEDQLQPCDIPKFRTNIEIAIQRAQELDLDTNPEDRWWKRERPGTHVYKTVQSILGLKRGRY